MEDSVVAQLCVVEITAQLRRTPLGHHQRAWKRADYAGAPRGVDLRSVDAFNLEAHDIFRSFLTTLPPARRRDG
jgi:hypothetical protein